VLLMLFTVGLKLKFKTIISPEVIGGSLLHFGITCFVFTPGLYLILDTAWYVAFVLAAALSFSSTVLAAKVLESKRELRAFHGRAARRPFTDVCIGCQPYSTVERTSVLLPDDPVPPACAQQFSNVAGAG
jgi:hypothetical protein